MFTCTNCGKKIAQPRDLSVREVKCECGTMVSFAAALTIMPGRVFNVPEDDIPEITGYRMVNKIGSGGMGTVYEAIQTSLKRKVAIKTLPAHLSLDPQFVNRFEREADTLSNLRHPNICGIIDKGETHGTYFIVMEYVCDNNGNISTLHELIKTRRLNSRSTLKLAKELAGGMAYAHSKGVIHRDLKPANVLIDEHSNAKIVDFGIAHIVGKDDVKAAQLTMAGEVVGTPSYMSPEQKIGATIDARSDVYSLGVIIYEMLTGELPEGRWDNPSKYGCASQWDTIIDKAIHKNPQNRFRKMEDFLSALELVGGSSVSSAPSNNNFEANPGPSLLQGKDISYYLMHGEQIIGPLSEAKIKKMAEHGTLAGGDKISTDRKRWQNIESTGWFIGENRETIKLNSSLAEQAVIPENQQVPEPVRREQPNKQLATKEINDVFPAHNNVSIISAIWDPVSVIPAIYNHYRDLGSRNIGFGMAMATFLIFYLTLLLVFLPASGRHITGGIMVGTIFVAAIPFFSLILGGYLIRLAFGEKNSGSFGGDILIAGTALLPSAVSVVGLIIVRKFLDSGQDPQLATILISAIAIYCFTHIVLSLYAGLTKISGVGEKYIVLIIPGMLIISGGILFLMLKKICGLFL
jgi:serine/threonine protein kinase